MSSLKGVVNCKVFYNNHRCKIVAVVLCWENLYPWRHPVWRHGSLSAMDVLRDRL